MEIQSLRKQVYVELLFGRSDVDMAEDLRLSLCAKQRTVMIGWKE